MWKASESLHPTEFHIDLVWNDRESVSLPTVGTKDSSVSTLSFSFFFWVGKSPSVHFLPFIRIWRSPKANPLIKPNTVFVGLIVASDQFRPLSR